MDQALDTEALKSILIALKEREPSLRFGTEQILHAMAVMDFLHRANRLPDDPARLSAYLSPVLCSSSEEQLLFRARFDRIVSSGWWARSGSAASDFQIPADPQGMSMPVPGLDPDAPLLPMAPDKGVLNRWQRQLSARTGRWDLLLAGLMVVVAVLVLTYWLFSGSPDGSTNLPVVTGTDIITERAVPSMPVIQADPRLMLASLPWIILAFLLAIRSRWRAKIIRQFTLRRFDEKEVRFGTPHDWHMAAQEIVPPMSHLRKPVLTDRMEFDLAASIKAATDNHGAALPQMRACLRQPEYMLLIWRTGAADHGHRVAQDIAMHLMRNDIAVAVYEVPGVAEKLLPRPDLSYAISPLPTERDGTVGLEDALIALPDATILIVGDGAGLISGEGTQSESAAALLSLRERRAILTPVPLQDWGEQEQWLEYGGYFVASADAEGLKQVAEALSDMGRTDVSLAGIDIHRRNRAGEYETLRNYPLLLRASAMRFQSHNPPADKFIDRLRDQLAGFLGKDGLRWLAALAVYPAINPDLTRLLGRRLKGSDARPLFNHQRYLALSQLPWVQHGTMPDWLRRVLIATMTTKETTEVKTVLRELLIQPTAAGSVALNFALRSDSDWRRIWQLLTTSTATGDRHDSDMMQDQVFIGFMSGKQDITVDAPSALIGLMQKLDQWAVGGLVLSMALSLILSTFISGIQTLAILDVVEEFLVAYGLQLVILLNLWLCTRAGDRITVIEAACGVGLLVTSMAAAQTWWQPSLMQATLVTSYGARLFLGRDEPAVRSILMALTDPAHWRLNAKRVVFHFGGVLLLTFVIYMISISDEKLFFNIAVDFFSSITVVIISTLYAAIIFNVYTFEKVNHCLGIALYFLSIFLLIVVENAPSLDSIISSIYSSKLSRDFLESISNNQVDIISIIYWPFISVLFQSGILLTIFFCAFSIAARYIGKIKINVMVNILFNYLITFVATPYLLLAYELSVSFDRQPYYGSSLVDKILLYQVMVNLLFLSAPQYFSSLLMKSITNRNLFNIGYLWLHYSLLYNMICALPVIILDYYGYQGDDIFAVLFYSSPVIAVISYFSSGKFVLFVDNFLKKDRSMPKIIEFTITMRLPVLAIYSFGRACRDVIIKIILFILTPRK